MENEMKIRVFQLKSGENREIAFRELDRVRKSRPELAFPNPEMYECVYDGKMKQGSLEDVFEILNLSPPGEYRGHALSVSDLVEIEGGKGVRDGTYYVEPAGFTKVDFSYPRPDEPSYTVLKVEPGKEPYKETIREGLAALQKEVGGYIEVCYPFEEEVGLVCNEEGKLNGMELNRVLRDGRDQIYDVIAGPFLVVGLSGDSFSSLSPENLDKFRNLFASPEYFAVRDGKLTVFRREEKETPMREERA